MRVGVLALALLSAACNYNHMKNPGGKKDIDSGSFSAPDYLTVQTILLGPKCLNCHSSGGGNKGGANFETYANVRAQLSQIANRTLEVKDMPPKEKLSEAELQILRNWLDVGAPEQKVAEGEKPDPTLERPPINWQKVSQKIFSGKCFACHAEPAPQAGLDLTSHKVVKEKAQLIFKRVIIDQDMPIAPYPALSPRERRVLLKWFDLGMPE